MTGLPILPCDRARPPERRTPTDGPVGLTIQVSVCDPCRHYHGQNGGWCAGGRSGMHSLEGARELPGGWTETPEWCPVARAGRKA